jgi:hypothetical protein
MAWANTLIARYGHVQDLRIDSVQKMIEVSCLLNGEPAPITIKVGRYEVETDQRRKYLRATDFSCTRPWLQALLCDYGHQRRIELPAWAALAL